MEKLLLNHTFKLYKCNTPDQFDVSPSSLKRLVTQQSQFWYNQYARHNTDIIPKFTSYKDIVSLTKCTHRKHSLPNYNLDIVTVKSKPFVTQVIIFVTTASSSKQFNTVVLLKSTTPQFLIQCLESNLSNAQHALVIKPLHLRNQAIENFVNKLTQPLPSSVKLGSVLGDMELAYSIPTASDLLKTLSLSIPAKDISRLFSSGTGIVDRINQYIGKHTHVSLGNLNLAKLQSRLIDLSSDGKVKIYGDNSSVFKSIQLDHPPVQQPQPEPSHDVDPFILFVIGSIYNCL